MSFMSFEYARQAADAALQFQQNQGQNIKSTQDDVKSVGNGNAQRKNENMRNKIEAEYNATSAEIKKKKAESMMKLKEDRMNRANQAAMLVLAGTLGGGIANGIADLIKGDGRQMSEEDQIGQLSNEQISPSDGTAGYATSFQVAKGGGNTEVGAVVSYSPDKGNFSVMGVNTTTGNVTGFQNISQTAMARGLLDTAPADSPVRKMLEEGPPPAFRREFLEADGKGMKQELKDELFGDNGFFAQGSRSADGGKTTIGSDAGENLAASFLEGPTEPGGARRTTNIGSAYKQSAQSALSLLQNPKIQQGLNINDKTVKNTENIFKDKDAVNRTGEGAKNAAQKLIFKPLGTSLNQFTAMNQVAKQYQEEYQDAKVEYEAAKRQAAAAQKKLQQIDSLLAAGTSA